MSPIAQWMTDPAHTTVIVVLLGMALGQLALLLPDSPGKTLLLNVLHGVFPSPQVIANGAHSAAPSLLTGLLDSTIPSTSTTDAIPPPPDTPIPPVKQGKP